MPRIGIGIDDFKELRSQGAYYVDKTPLIRAVIEGSKCLLLPRPRRFGKTLNLSMLRYFFDRRNAAAVTREPRKFSEYGCFQHGPLGP